MKRSKIVIFGGAFNPPTLAHESIIAALLARREFDEVWVLVSGDRLDKHIGISDKIRLEMLELVKATGFKNDPRLIISDFELRLPRPTKTYQTVQALEKTYPEKEFWFSFGADSYASILEWPHGAQLREMLTRLVLVSRSDQAVPVTGGNVIRLRIVGDFKDVSSSEVRKLAASGLSIKDIVSEPVADFIRQNRLYVTQA